MVKYFAFRKSSLIQCTCTCFLKLVLDTPSSGVDAKVKRGVKQELALPSKQNLLVSCQDCQKALMTV